MRIVSIREAKTQLSSLIDAALRGESVVVAKGGRPLVQVLAVDAPVKQRHVGFLAGAIKVPRDFDRMGVGELARDFGVSR